MDPKHLRAAAEQQPDRLDPQPLAIAALLLLITGAVVAAVVRDTWVRRAASAVISALAGVFLVADQGTVEALLQARLQAQLAAPMPAGKSATDFVHTGNGFGISLLLSAVLLVGNLAGWWRTHRGTRSAVPAEPLSTVDR